MREVVVALTKIISEYETQTDRIISNPEEFIEELLLLTSKSHDLDRLLYQLKIFMIRKV